MSKSCKIIFPVIICCLLIVLSCRQNVRVTLNLAPCPLPTQWTERVDPLKPWPEYPRPQMVRKEWMNLNGLWDYAILPADTMNPSPFQGQILVPFPVESALSGVGKHLLPDQKLWYMKEFKLPKDWEGKRVLLHFEASDWETRVLVNGKHVGSHRGGYDPFQFDITDALKKRGTQIILVSVWDPTDQGWQPRGKQVGSPKGIFYTATSGIWQTVWIEPVGDDYIKELNITPVMNEGGWGLVLGGQTPQTDGEIQQLKDSIEFIVKAGEKIIATKRGPAGQKQYVKIDKPRLWSTEDPFLYDLDVTLYTDGKITDHVTSYTGLRRISLGKDDKGITRIMLNDRFIFQNGPLDQGFWPDGIYTPPSDEAMRYDLRIIKKLGFNMLRKHVKVESRRFYTWCDRMGILVWQDMPSAFKNLPEGNTSEKRPDKANVQFEQELRRMIINHSNNPCIIMWVPFNEGWGQYDTERIVGLIRGFDPSRLVDNASGWSDMKAGDVIDRHHYPEPVAPRPETSRAAVLGEFGGLGFAMTGHTWQQENWGYQQMTSPEDLLELYRTFYDSVLKFKYDPGLSASIYTQITDVETECNGLMTYDRAAIKMDTAQLYKINRKPINE
jgi:hypothetical protein